MGECSLRDSLSCETNPRVVLLHLGNKQGEAVAEGKHQIMIISIWRTIISRMHLNWRMVVKEFAYKTRTEKIAYFFGDSYFKVQCRYVKVTLKLLIV